VDSSDRGRIVSGALEVVKVVGSAAIAGVAIGALGCVPNPPPAHQQVTAAQVAQESGHDLPEPEYDHYVGPDHSLTSGGGGVGVATARGEAFDATVAVTT
jgi:hypothetical protein